MTVSYTIVLTYAEHKALSIVAASPKDWIENVVHERCRIAIDDIVASEVERITTEGGTIAGTKDEIVMAASIKTAAERNAEDNNSLI